MLGDLAYVYDPNSGWLIDPETGAFHDAYYGFAYDAERGCLVDGATGKCYDMSYNELVAEDPEQAASEGAAATEEGE